ncbi:unnamed protein product [Rotaria sp. Silwood1]|nr:unnamed protein product [Rotaria sp. Silwood1]CAF1612031.1 unnamed protein product [Rotaria sp. Silwood1]CAF3723519.1 unnamed protein product [Rotaria sp. Silwood1]CAF4642297.1 unnamed protein product [Rotaria sp. Silwood1]CAF4765748.1 unnamed protein product [Rotaria sp. Silwood1]
MGCFDLNNAEDGRDRFFLYAMIIVPFISSGCYVFDAWHHYVYHPDSRNYEGLMSTIVIVFIYLQYCAPIQSRRLLAIYHILLWIITEIANLGYLIFYIQKGTPPASLCTSITTRICGFYNELSRVMTAAIIPGCIIFVFGVGTIRHLKKVRVAVGIATIQNSHSYHRLRKTDRQLIQMLIGQVAMIFISWIPHAVQRINVVITFDDIKSPLRSRQDTLWDQIAWIITTFDCSFSFYVYLFTGGILFRQTVRSIFGCRTSTSRTRMLDATNHVQRSRRT